ncbi:MAG TPA: hypothetical protein RMH99_06790, partial [Sandaracinaceae bacterium LLY-WYZ-13_1]|nr:hypothetical protein [Sandaracinaceae bacterium LLY-WYZ-13_1]
MRLGPVTCLALGLACAACDGQAPLDASADAPSASCDPASAFEVGDPEGRADPLAASGARA